MHYPISHFLHRDALNIVARGIKTDYLRFHSINYVSMFCTFIEINDIRQAQSGIYRQFLLYLLLTNKLNLAHYRFRKATQCTGSEFSSVPVITVIYIPI
jgi:hypothetical protein